jgi:uncharacterized membrane protein (UPF0136 family)
MKKFDIVIVGYSLLLLIGGVIGYLVAGSIPSLLMSSLFAALLIGSLFFMRFYPAYGYRAVSFLLIALTFFFAYRWYAGKFLPSGLLTFVTLAALTYTYMMQPKEEPRS